MASIKDLKKRITTVKNTQQTTRAMKMVSAAKLRRAQEGIQNQRPYAKRILELIQELSRKVSLPGEHPLLRREESVAAQQQKKTLLVIVTSDRGLCGGFNASVIKFCQRWLKTQALAQPQGWVEVAFVGKRGYDFFKTKKVRVGHFYSEVGGKVSFAKAKLLADALVQRYVEGEVDEIKIIYNEFKNAVTQQVTLETFLPLTPAGSEDVSGSGVVEAGDVIVKPSPREVLTQLLEKNFAIQIFRILLESQAGEHGARMSAMENATKNAGEMIRKLTLLYNKQRQASITKELLEIISGSESQKA